MPLVFERRTVWTRTMPIKRLSAGIYVLAVIRKRSFLDCRRPPSAAGAAELAWNSGEGIDPAAELTANDTLANGS